MSFVCTLPDDPSEADFFDDGDGYCSIVVRLGYDDETYRLYSLCAGLGPSESGKGSEYYFSVLDHDPVNGDTRQIFDAIEVGKIVGRQHRPAMLASFIEATRLLLGKVAPAAFAVTTFHSNLPDKALEKYRRINHLFNEQGYVVTELEPVDGHHLWLVERDE